jgi:hypothetical protein
MPRTIITAADLRNKSRQNLGTGNPVKDLPFSNKAHLSQPDANQSDFKSTQDLVKQYSVKPDDYTERLIKYIPSEAIALYLTLDPLVRPSLGSSATGNEGIHWLIFIACACLTWFYLYRVLNVRKHVQLMISVGAFLVWVFAIGGPFVYLGWYKPLYGGIILPLYTAFIPTVEP